MRILLFSLGIFFASVIVAQESLTPENLWKLKRVSSESVSPDGTKMLYNVRSYELEADKGSTTIYVMNVNGSDRERIVRESIFDVQWRPDGKKIGYLSGQSGSVQLWEMNPDGSEDSQVTDFAFDISNWHYAPNMQHISFTMEVQVEQTLAQKHSDLPLATGKSYDNLMFRHWTQWHDHAYSHVCIADYTGGKAGKTHTDIMEGEAFDSPLPPFGGGEQIAWAPDGKSLVYVSKKKPGTEWAVSTNSDIYQYDLSTKSTKNLSADNAGYDNDPSYSPDGSKLAWLSMKKDGFEADKNIIHILDLKTGKHVYTTESVDQTFGHAVWTATGDKIYSLSPVDATYQVYEISLNKDNTMKSIRAVTSGIHNINSVAIAGKNLIGSKSTMSMPNELFIWDIKTGKEAPLTTENNGMLGQMKMGKVEKRMIATTDGKEMLTWVIYPPDFDPSKKYPTLLYCQGGPQSAVSQFFSYRWNFQLMAANGYIIVAPNRRGLPSFGQKWNDDISEDWGGQAMKDYLSAIDEVAKEPFVDNDNLGAVGASYGGYSVYYLAGIHEGRFKTFISHCGLYNLESWYASTEELFFANWDIGGPYWEQPTPKSYNLFSPHKLVQNWDTPILVIHNELDFRVPLNQGLEAFTAAQLKGIPSKLLYYPDEGHWVLKPQNGVMWHREFYGWLEEWLK
ncbi:MAG: S9 family peptidase [Flavobacteriales bacterium]|nr:S9 family peptidase [Flavobacteriales bacterium]